MINNMVKIIFKVRLNSSVSFVQSLKNNIFYILVDTYVGFNTSQASTCIIPGNLHFIPA